MNILLASTSENEAKALIKALSTPHLRILTFQTVQIASSSAMQPLIGFDTLANAARLRANDAYELQPHGTVGLGIEYGLIKIEDRYLYAAALFLVLPDTEILATTPGFEISRELVNQAKRSKHSIQRTIQNLMRHRDGHDTTFLAAYRRVSDADILTETIKHLLTSVDWTVYAPQRSAFSL